MLTFSINIGDDDESRNYDLTDLDQLEVLLNTLADNESGLINPVDIRDAVFTISTNTGFKQTSATGSSLTYIGIDSDNPSSRDLKIPIFIGKRSYSGASSYTASHDILSASPSIATASDVIFFNTKEDSDSQLITKISILAGDDPTLYAYSPYVSAQYVVGTTSYLSLNIVADNTIEIDSSTTSINDIKIDDNVDDGYVFVYDDYGNMKLDATEQTFGDIGTSSATMSIFGNTYLNDYPLFFTDDRWVTYQMSDINIGEQFNNNSVTEVIRRMVYDYQPPSGSLVITGEYSNGFAEVGTFPFLTFNYVINKKTDPTNITTLENMNPNTYQAISSDYYVTINGTAGSSTDFSTSPIQNITSTFSLKINDGTTYTTYLETIKGVYPYYINVGTYSIKIVEDKEDIKYLQYDIDSSGYVTIMYPYIHGTLSVIKDNYDNNVTGSFSLSTITHYSEYGYWSGVTYYKYVSNYNEIVYGGSEIIYTIEY